MLLLDLDDPAGRDAAARWLAAHHGLRVGATVPLWRAERLDRAGRWEPLMSVWVLGTPGESRLFFIDHGAPLDHERVLPGISTLTDPAEALRAACLAAVGKAG